jgi:hypothetical protein
MWERFFKWVSGVAALQAIAIAAVCLLVIGAFGLGIIVAQARPPLPPVSAPSDVPPDVRVPAHGTYGSIDRIDGNVIRLRDPRSGRIWSVRASSKTVIEFGPRRPIPLQALRPGQRVFVVGSANANELDASFIGVVLGQGQRYLAPAPAPTCEGCFD